MKQNILVILSLLISSITGGGELLAQQWEIELPNRTDMLHGFVTEDNTLVIVGGFYVPEDSCSDGIMMRVHDDGQYELKTFPPNGNKHLEFEGVYPLPNGGYFTIASNYVFDFPTKLGDLSIMILDEDMNITWEQTFQAEDFDDFDGSCSVMDDDGTVVVLATARRPGPYGRTDYNGVLFRFTLEGELLQCRYLVADPPDPIAYMYSIRDIQIVNDTYSDRTIALGDGPNGIPSLLIFDHEFNLLDCPQLNDPSIPDTVLSYLLHRHVVYPRSDYWYNENEILVSGHQDDTTHGIHNHYHLLVGRVNLQGEVLQKTEILKQDSLTYNLAMAYANDSTVYVAARCHTVNWSIPLYPHYYLLTTGLELLGRIELWDKLNYFPLGLFATTDGGCFSFMERSTLYYDETQPKIVRFNRDDFHPISISVKETPLSDLHANAFPNPAKDELNIDLTGLSGNEVRRIRITDVHGHPCLDRVIYGQGNVLTLCVANLSDGIYTYSIYNNDRNIITGKFIKE